MTRDELQKLTSLLLDDTPSDELLGALSDYLRDHPDERQQIVDQLFIDSLLADELGTVSVAGLVDMVGAEPVMEFAAAPPAAETLSSSARQARGVRWRWLAGMAAAILITAVSVAVIVNSWQMDADRVVEHVDP